MGKIIKIVLIVMLVLLLVAGLGVLAYLREWDWKWVAAGVLGAVLLIALVWFGIHALKKRKAQPKAAASPSANPLMQKRLQRVEQVFQAAVDRIKKSKLREKGNPIYVLPWYLIIGETGVGKTTALRNSRVAIPLLEGALAPKKEEDLGNWWLLDEAIVIDTPGRYLAAQGEADKLEWERVKALLRKHRGLLPVNGVVVALSADRLLHDNDETLKAHAAAIRQRLADIVRTLGVKFPVYVMVTKCDLISGMSRFVDQFPEALLMQAMGGLNKQQGVRVGDQVDRIFQSVRAGLEEMRLAMLADAKAHEVAAPAYVFPDELAALGRAARVCVDAMLDNTLFDEAPQFRGLYFTSGHQEGQPTSSLLPYEFLGEVAAGQRVGERSIFLRGLLGRVLKNDRMLAAPTKKSVYGQNLRDNLGLAGWVVGCLLVGVVVSFSFVGNLSGLKAASQSLPADLALKHDLAGDLALLDGLRVAIEKLHQHHEQSWLPSFGLGHSRDAEEQLKTVFVGKFREAILAPFDKDFDLAVSDLAYLSSPSELARIVDFMTKRIEWHQAALDGRLFDDETPIDEPDLSLMVELLSGTPKSEQGAASVAANYRAYLAWSEDKRLIEGDKDKDRQRLMALMGNDRIGLDWLVEWANMQGRIDAVDLKTYWGVGPRVDKDSALQVVRAFTPAGWKAVSDFATEIEKAAGATESIAAKRQAFFTDYRRNYFRKWREFSLAFDKGGDAFSGREKRVEMALLVGKKESPYIKFLADLPKQLAPAIEGVEQSEEIPAWVALVFRYEKLVDPSYQAALASGDSLVGKVVKKGEAALGKLKVKKGADSEESELTVDKKAIPLVNAYQETVTQVAEKAQSAKASFLLAKEVYVESQTLTGEPQQSMNKNEWARERLRELLGKGQAAEDVFWFLLARRAEQAWDVVTDEAEQFLDQAWQTDVLGAAQGLTGWQKVDELQGAQGKVWEFQKTYADAFLKKSRGGFVTQVLHRDQIRFTQKFLDVLSQGKVSQQALSGKYRVEVAAKPTDVNRSAKVRPHLTKLSLQCAAGNTELANYNFPVQAVFTWTPQDCGDVVIEIAFPDVTLQHRYAGFDGFVRFLKDFRTGVKSFTPDVFPEYKAKLASYQIEVITLNYAFSGHDSVMGVAMKDPATIPENIVQLTGAR